MVAVFQESPKHIRAVHTRAPLEEVELRDLVNAAPAPANCVDKLGHLFLASLPSRHLQKFK